MERLQRSTVFSWLEEVKDPEIPVLSLVDLGVITDVKINDESVHVTMTPTFVGCPALEFMREEVVAVLKKRGIENPQVSVSFSTPWSSDRISEKGRQALKKFGLAPPASADLITDISILEHVRCPRCDSMDTELKTPFGPTLCRSIHYCNNCKEAFEQFKPL